jgi:sulfonate transport system substrate-binding protein
MGKEVNKMGIFHWKQTIGISSAMLLLAVTVGCGAAADGSKSPAQQGTETKNAAAPASITTVKLGLDTAATGSPQFRMAKAKGYFEKNGIKAETSDFPYGIDTLNAMLVNRTEIGSAADYALLNSLGKGDMVIVGTLSRSTDISAKNTVLLVKGNIQSEKDLVGKRLGVARGTVFEYMWDRYLEKSKIAKSQVTMVNYSSPDEAIVAFQRGQMDAIWASGALLQKLKEVEGVKQLTDSSASGVAIRAFMVAQRSFAEKQPDAVGGILKSLNEATDYIKGNKEETAQVLFDTIKLPKEGVLRDLEAAAYVIGFTKEDYEHLQQMQTWLVENGLLKDKYDLKSKINAGPIKKALPDLVNYTP